MESMTENKELLEVVSALANGEYDFDLSEDGYYRMPNGFLLQWGVYRNQPPGRRNLVFPAVDFQTVFFKMAEILDYSEQVIPSQDHLAISQAYITDDARLSVYHNDKILSHDIRWMAIGI